MLLAAPASDTQSLHTGDRTHVCLRIVSQAVVLPLSGPFKLSLNSSSIVLALSDTGMT